MKQILSLALALLPYLAWAQYPSNGNQKITLGEQTTADGLVYRGVANIDTVTATSKITRANKQDTSAFILLDTVTNLLWHYKTGSNAWIQAGGGVSVTSFSAGTTGLTPSTATTGAVTLGGTLAVANGGTNNTSYINGAIPYSNGTMLTSDTSKLFFDNTNAQLGLNTTNFNDPIFGSSKFKIVDGTMDFSFRDHNTGQGWFAVRSRTNNISGFTGHTNSSSDAFVMGSISNHGLELRTNNTDRLFISNTGEVTINNLAGSGDRTVIASATGVLSAPVSSITTKENVQILNYGLNEILQINPVSFDYIDKDKWGEERKLGFIVEDIFPIVPEVTGTMNDGDLYLDMVKLIPILTKAIQEQQALIKALEQRIINLENK
jgi:hypothetical protein